MSVGGLDINLWRVLLSGMASMATAAILWVLVSVSIAIHNLLDQRPFKLTAISVGNRLLTLLAMALIYGWLHP